MTHSCPIHGDLDSEWCEDCGEVFECDCTNHIRTRFKDLVYDCDKGERTITIWITSCGTCGEFISVEEN